MKKTCIVITISFAMLAMRLCAQRETVLRQIDLPHNYYYREMYLPQLTSDPSFVAWSPDSKSVVYSMQGSLWRQRIGSGIAQECVAGPGYDYQPDWSPDGRWIIFDKYEHDAIELYLLEEATGKTFQLTHEGAVNVEPRWSPDGKRVAFVSTRYHRHFHIFIAEFDPASRSLLSIEQLTGESKSNLPRYYYSQFDHEISPVWSPDGKEILFISNRGHIHGTGGFWRIEARSGAQPREIHYEETTWKARPDWSPDGRRVVYGSYLGRSWHQLWLMTSEGGDVFPLTYGDYDNINPRWSPDGKKIAFISNRGGNTSLWMLEVPGDAQYELKQNALKRLNSIDLNVAILDEHRSVTPARVSVIGSDGRSYAPDHALVHADDGFDRHERPFEVHYFHSPPAIFRLAVPPGPVEIEVVKGPDYQVARRKIVLHSATKRPIIIQLKKLTFGDEGREKWASGDVHVHMNYAGAYRMTPRDLVSQMQAENLNVIQNLIVNKEQRFPDIEYANRLGVLDPASTPDFQILHGQEFHTSYWGHLGILHPEKNLVLPGYAGYPNTSAASLYPMNADVADLAHAEGALTGYVHPFDSFPDPLHDEKLTNELPVDVALGKVDYYEVVGFSDHKSSAAVWYKLLNLGFRIPAAAGTDAMTNYASLRGPVGMNRVYVHVPSGTLRMKKWLDGLKQGRTFVTNGPLLRFSLGGVPIGGEIKLPLGTHHVPFTARMQSMVPIDHLEVVCNGVVVQSLTLAHGHQSADVRGNIPIDRSGWCVLRAWADHAEEPVLDIYPYASTSPIYVTVGSLRPRSTEDAQYFLAWIDRLIEAARAHTGYNTEAEKQHLLGILARAQTVYERLRR